MPTDFLRLTRNLEELDSAVAEFREKGAKVLAVLGGDGSVHHLLDTILRRYEETELPIVLTLAGGTMNGLPRALGTGGSPERVLRSALAAIEREVPPVRYRHVLRVTDKPAGRTRYGIGFAAGLVYRVHEQYYRNSDPGIAHALRASLIPVTAALFGGSFYEGVRLDVRADGIPWLPEAPHTVVAGVVDNPLLWFRPFGAPLGDAEAFHLAATSMPPRELVPRLWSLFRGRCHHPRLRIDRARDASVRGNTGYIIDGDLYPGGGAVDVRLSLGPRFRFLVPAQRLAPAPLTTMDRREGGRPVSGR